jgi:hypothetical protein
MLERKEASLSLASVRAIWFWVFIVSLLIKYKVLYQIIAGLSSALAVGVHEESEWLRTFSRSIYIWIAFFPLSLSTQQKPLYQILRDIEPQGMDSERIIRDNHAAIFIHAQTPLGIKFGFDHTIAKCKGRCLPIFGDFDLLESFQLQLCILSLQLLNLSLCALQLIQ